MEFIMQPKSMQYLSLRQIAITFWENNYNYQVCTNVSKCTDALEKIAIRFPSDFRPLLMHLGTQIASEISEWINYLCAKVGQSAGLKIGELIRFTRWTDGKLDERKTVQILLDGNHGLTMDDKFRFACAYCLQDEVALIWPELQFNLRHSYFNDLHHINGYWAGIAAKTNMFSVVTSSDNRLKMFTWILKNGTQSAVEYFMSQYDPVDILAATSNFTRRFWMCSWQSRNNLQFLFAKLTDVQLSTVFENTNVNRLGISALIVSWAQDESRLSTIARIWRYCDHVTMYKLMYTVVEQTVTIYGDLYIEFFKYLWMNLKPDCKQFVLNRECAHHDNCFTQLCLFGDAENVELILTDANAEQRNQLLWLFIFNYNDQVDWPFFLSVVQSLSLQNELNVLMKRCVDNVERLSTQLNSLNI